MSQVNYTQKTRDYLEKRGFTVETVEHWIPYTLRRKDLFGIIDLLAITDTRTIGIQSTSIAARMPHLRKIYWDSVLDAQGDVLGTVINQSTYKWLQGGRELMLICWSKKKIKRGGIAFRYEPRVEYITLATCDAVWTNKKSETDSTIEEITSSSSDLV